MDLEVNLLDKFEEFLQNNIPTKKSFHPHFEVAMKKMFSAGGKRFRPLLLLNVVQNYTPLLVKNAFYPALSLEMIHTYSLIHDDLPTFDNSPLRRGVETLHVTYDEVTATLVADALNTDAFLVLSKSPLSSDTIVKLTRELSYGAGVNGMVLGQAIDCHFENQKLSLDELMFIHIHKTAYLIATALKMGAIISNLPKQNIELFGELGLKIGLLFQVVDDIIDATKSSDEAGKPTNNDTNKNSYTNLLGVDGANQKRDELKVEINELLDKLDSNMRQKLQKMIEKYL